MYWYVQVQCQSLEIISSWNIAMAFQTTASKHKHNFFQKLLMKLKFWTYDDIWVYLYDNVDNNEKNNDAGTAAST